MKSLLYSFVLLFTAMLLRSEPPPVLDRSMLIWTTNSVFENVVNYAVYHTDSKTNNFNKNKWLLLANVPANNTTNIHGQFYVFYRFKPADNINVNSKFVVIAKNKFGESEPSNLIGVLPNSPTVFYLPPSGPPPPPINQPTNQLPIE